MDVLPTCMSMYMCTPGANRSQKRAFTIPGAKGNDELPSVVLGNQTGVLWKSSHYS